jgi:hypothetical protein
MIVVLIITNAVRLLSFASKESLFDKKTRSLSLSLSFMCTIACNVEVGLRRDF